MKTLHIAFEDKEYADLLNQKGKTTWRELILKKAKQ
jgi:hypothetical protein